MALARNIHLYEAVAEKAAAMADLLGVNAVDSVEAAVKGSDVVFICVKPDQFSAAAAGIKSAWKGGKPCLVTIMAGVKTARVKELVSADAAVIRVMPNVACTISMGIAGVAADPSASHEINDFVFNLFEILGGAVWVPETKLDAVTAVNGSGPAYVFMFIEALTHAGVMVGLDRVTAEKLAVQTVAGAAGMVEKTDFDTLQLRAQVSSPGGTTVAATTVLERAGFRAAVIDAVTAAWKRAVELGG
jgi:pyrroline-5-carboxylate reductase